MKGREEKRALCQNNGHVTLLCQIRERGKSGTKLVNKK